jgi:adenosyl cobinamide kinase/adenosyl cobinamide phosphate guanylyltransferase
MSSLTLVLGGARSGKSTHAEALAQTLAGEDVLYIATAQALDTEMQDRIAAHRAQRPAAWPTLEAPLHLSRALRLQAPAQKVWLLDCLTLLASNCLLAHESAAEAESALQQELVDLLAVQMTLAAHLIVVSNEVGLGLVPDNALGRAYRDLLGRANQFLAQAADEVIFMVAGLALPIKQP